MFFKLFIGDTAQLEYIRRNDNLFRQWIEEIIEYDKKADVIILKRFGEYPFEEYFKQEIPFSQIIILLEGAIWEYNNTSTGSDLEYNLEDYLKKYPVTAEQGKQLLEKIEDIKNPIDRALVKEKIEKSIK